MKTISVARIRWARALAVGADLLQVGLPFLFGEGFLSPLDDALDAAICILMTVLVGWHIAFLPSFAIKLVPIVDMAPTWTIAVFIATHGRKAAVERSANPAAVPPKIS